MSKKPEHDPFSLKAGIPPIEGDLRPKPKASARLSRRVFGVMAVVVLLLVSVFLYSLDQIDSKPSREPERKPETELNTANVNKVPDDLMGKDPQLGATGKQSASLVKTPSPSEWLEQVNSVAAESNGTKGVVPPAGSQPVAAGNKVPPASGIPPAASDTANKQLTPAEQERLTAQQERMARMRQARSNGLESKPFDGPTAGGVTAGAEAAAATTRAAFESMAQANPGAAVADAGQQRRADGDQDEKLDFLKTSGKESHNYHPHVPVAPISKNEVKVGHLIPARLQQGINSDLPGQVTARVSEWVYDSVTGCRGLIPPHSTLIGKYDSKVAIGQVRVLTVWNMLVFPDGSELTLTGMQGYDMAGMAGMEANEVDNHLLRVFGVGLGMSLITAGVQASVPKPAQSQNGTTVPTFGQQVGTGLAQQYGQLGGQLMGKYASVQPTLKNIPGEAFNIMVPRTIVFSKVWKNRC